MALLLLIFSTWSGTAAADVQDEFSESQSTSFWEGEWSLLENAAESEYPLREFSGFVHSPLGTFDPLVEAMPIGPDWLMNPDNPTNPRMMLVQSFTSDLTPLITI